MRFLFVSPPSRFDLKKNLGIVGIPLGLGYLASVLEKENHKVKIIDAPVLDYTLEDIKEEIKEFKPDWVGITSVTSTIYDAYKVAEIAKEVDPEIRTIMGGPHVSFTARKTLEECRFVDVVARGEGEGVVLDIAKGYDLSEIKGITYREDGEIRENEPRGFIQDLDNLPFPAYHLFPMERYQIEGERFANIITSRGCPFSCIFCSSSALCGKRWRARSPGNVVEELEFLKDRYGITEVEFLDDTFTLNRHRAEEICDLMIKKRLNIRWSCSSRVDTISQALVKKLKRAGCYLLYLGIESGSQKLLDTIQKKITLAQARDAVRMIKEQGLQTVCTFMLGIPGETVKTIKSTINFAKRLNPSMAQFTLLTPYPGTKLFSIADKKGWILTKDWSKYTIIKSVMEVPGLTNRVLNKWLSKAYLSFYVRPSFLFEKLKRREVYFIKRAPKAVLNYIKSG